MIEIKYM